jgi:hypothetical protein
VVSELVQDAEVRAARRKHDVSVLRRRDPLACALGGLWPDEADVAGQLRYLTRDEHVGDGDGVPSLWRITASPRWWPSVMR